MVDLVTGATGFIGGQLVKELLKRGRKLRLLVREGRDIAKLRNARVEIFYGDLNKPETLKNISKGADVVYHAAGQLGGAGVSYKQLRKTNVEGTENLLKACLDHKPKRFVHFSSTVVYGFNGNINTDESSELKPFKSGYCRSKALAEEQLFRFSGDIELIILRPSNIFGPEDTVFTYLITWAMDKRILFAFPKAGETLTSPCYIKNIVTATEKALKVTAKKGPCEVYNISDGNDIDWKRYLNLIAGQLGKKPPRRSAPVKPLLFAARMLEIIYTLLKIRSRPPITPHDIAHVSDDYSFSIDKAKTKLGYNPVFTTEKGIAETVNWYREYRLK